MKEYPKVYEDFYSKEKKDKFLDIDAVTTDIGLDAHEYAKLLKKELKKSEEKIFDALVKYHWLVARFHYLGRKRKYAWANGYFLDTAFGMFFKNYANCNKDIFSNHKFFKISSYFNEMFPHFHVYSPIDNPEKYKYPFKNIGLSYLLVINQMDDRMDLLKKADKEKMTYHDFVNYVMNHALCINDELGREKYGIGCNDDHTMFIRNNDISLKEKKRLV